MSRSGILFIPNKVNLDAGVLLTSASIYEENISILTLFFVTKGRKLRYLY